MRRALPAITKPSSAPPLPTENRFVPVAQIEAAIGRLRRHRFGRGASVEAVHLHDLRLKELTHLYAELMTRRQLGVYLIQLSLVVRHALQVVHDDEKAE